MQVFIAALFITVKNRKQPKFPQLVSRYAHKIEYYSVIKGLNYLYMQQHGDSRVLCHGRGLPGLEMEGGEWVTVEKEAQDSLEKVWGKWLLSWLWQWLHDYIYIFVKNHGTVYFKKVSYTSVNLTLKHTCRRGFSIFLLRQKCKLK